jgi:hypothetical protein
MLRVTMRSAVPRKRPSIGNRNSPRNGCDLPPLDVIRNKLHFRRVTLDIDIVMACTDTAVAQLLALYDSIRNSPDDWAGRTITHEHSRKRGSSRMAAAILRSFCLPHDPYYRRPNGIGITSARFGKKACTGTHVPVFNAPICALGELGVRCDIPNSIYIGVARHLQQLIHFDASILFELPAACLEVVSRRAYANTHYNRIGRKNLSIREFDLGQYITWLLANRLDGCRTMEDNALRLVEVLQAGANFSSKNSLEGILFHPDGVNRGEFALGNSYNKFHADEGTADYDKVLPLLAGLNRCKLSYHKNRGNCTRINLLRILDCSERVNILEVCTFNWETTRNAATGKDKCVIRDYFLSIVKNHRLGVGVYERDSLFPSWY